MTTHRALLLAAATALLALLFPLPVYALSLGAFGLIHVLAELRYVDLRFAGRVSRRLLAGWSLLLGAVVLIRVLAMTGALTGEPRAHAELGVVVLLALSVLGVAWSRGSTAGFPGGLTMLVVVALLFGGATAPFETLVILALLHNLTPIAFLAERLDGASRRLAMSLCAVTFGALPLLILTGLPRRGLMWLGWDGAALPVPGVGVVTAHQGVFVPSWLSGPLAVDLFTAAVYLQCLHYAVVIGVLPRLIPAGAGAGVVPWPRSRAFTVLLATVGAISLVAFSREFAGTRALYGVFAAVHAWIEVPVLLAAVALARPARALVTP